MDKREFLETWNRRVWEEEDLSAIEDLFKPDALARGLVDDSHVGPDEFAAFAAAILELVSGTRVTIEAFIEQGDWLSAVLSFRAEDRKTGRKIAFTGQAFCKVIDGILVESYNHFDAISLYEQLDLMPENTFEICLLGERIG